MRTHYEIFVHLPFCEMALSRRRITPCKDIMRTFIRHMQSPGFNSQHAMLALPLEHAETATETVRGGTRLQFQCLAG